MALAGAGDEGEGFNWLALWSVGRYDLLLSEQEFWRLTPRLLYGLMKRWELEQERRDFRAGMIASTIANSSRVAFRRVRRVAGVKLPDSALFVRIGERQFAPRAWISDRRSGGRLSRKFRVHSISLTTI